MGRPLSQRFFGNRNGGGTGGEAVIYANVASAGTGYYSANAAVAFSAPQITGGSTALGTVSLNGTGNVTVINITNAGTGYTSAPVITITGANASGALGTATIYGPGVTPNAISANAWVDGGGTGRIGDIVAQKGARRYKIANDEGTSAVILEANDTTLAAGGPSAEGNCTITASESTGATYYVLKLNSRTATLGVRISGTQFANLQQVPWTLGSAVANVSVSISSL